MRGGRPATHHVLWDRSTQAGSDPTRAFRARIAADGAVTGPVQFSGGAGLPGRYAPVGVWTGEALAVAWGQIASGVHRGDLHLGTLGGAGRLVAGLQAIGRVDEYQFPALAAGRVSTAVVWRHPEPVEGDAPRVRFHLDEGGRATAGELPSVAADVSDPTAVFDSEAGVYLAAWREGAGDAAALRLALLSEFGDVASSGLELGSPRGAPALAAAGGVAWLDEAATVRFTVVRPGCPGVDPCGGRAPARETCNGLDDDCDGHIDDFAGVQEACNQVDDDCDGQVDEEILEVPCVTDEPGVCSPGLLICDAGRAVCRRLRGPSAREPCAGEDGAAVKDDSCDGRINEGCGCDEGQALDCYHGPVGTLRVGACRAGRTTCDGSRTLGECVGEVLPSPEVAGNQVDEDCDGFLAP